MFKPLVLVLYLLGSTVQKFDIRQLVPLDGPVADADYSPDGRWLGILSPFRMHIFRAQTMLKLQ